MHVENMFIAPPVCLFVNFSLFKPRLQLHFYSEKVKKVIQEEGTW